MLETDRLILRPWRAADAAIVHELWTERDDRVPPHRRLSPDGHPTVADLEARGFPEGLLMIELRATGDLIGYCGLTDEPELAYELLHRFWGHGYATEAARAVIDRARDSGAVRLRAGVRNWNLASQRVLAKLGFEVERVEPNAEWGDSLVMSVRLAAAD
jgi:[ribosomal protein S5]-alanine N-acetyltransferase